MNTTSAPPPKPCHRPVPVSSFSAELKKLLAHLVTLR